jgi:hypothetical protein
VAEAKVLEDKTIILKTTLNEHGEVVFEDQTEIGPKRDNVDKKWATLPVREVGKESSQKQATELVARIFAILFKELRVNDSSEESLKQFGMLFTRNLWVNFFIRIFDFLPRKGTESEQTFRKSLQQMRLRVPSGRAEEFKKILNTLTTESSAAPAAQNMFTCEVEKCKNYKGVETPQEHFLIITPTDLRS